MGTLRVYLALCVIAAHAHSVFPWRMHDGKQAVQIFYVISGFYMAMVLSSRYSNPKDFYFSRVMRIFPPYWIVLISTLVASVAAGLLANQWLLLTRYATHPLDHNGTAGVVLAALSNLTVFGQDWVMFLSHDYGQTLHITQDFTRDASPLHTYLLVPPCWSVGLELTFYTFAPYLNRLRSRWLALIALAALGARLIAYCHFDLGHDPWDYRFFPFEISLFLGGMLGYRLYKLTSPHHPSQRFRMVSGLPYLTGVATLLLLLYAHACLMDYLGHLASPALGVLITLPFWTVGVPVLFFVFGNQKLDRVIGELSYPIYLVHYLVIGIMGCVLGHFGLNRWMGESSALISTIAALIFYHFLIVPLDRKRHSMLKSKLIGESGG
jgi:peptidoglycan/LPS O-acetylase OafA/YrhL